MQAWIWRTAKKAKIAAFKNIKIIFYIFLCWLLLKRSEVIRENTTQFLHPEIFTSSFLPGDVISSKHSRPRTNVSLLLLRTPMVVMMTVIFIAHTIIRAGEMQCPHHHHQASTHISRGHEMTRAKRGDRVIPPPPLLTTEVYPRFGACSSRHALSVGPTLPTAYDHLKLHCSPSTVGEVTQ